MATINILPGKIYNRISAGEVVERPCSVVKELVENSLDSGAKSIAVEIRRGGKSSISVFDNGCGIERSELKKAVLPHATSKIRTLSDLDAIATLGFRGEALASIASVSKLTIKSKTEDSEIGSQIYCEGGTNGEVTEVGLACGTEIICDNLFFNAPVRAKFLKSDKSEESEITSLMSKFILGNPDIAFKYVADGKTLLQSFGDGQESAFVKVYGTSALNDCFFIDTEKNGIKITGYLGKIHFTKSNRSYQTVFLNGRYVVNQTIASAISNAYASYLMKRQYPFYVLNVTVPNDFVDVNVHPNKIDVRFMNNQIVYGALYFVVSKVLDGTSEILEIVSKSKNAEIVQAISDPQNFSIYLENKNDNFDDKSYNSDGNFNYTKSLNKGDEKKNVRTYDADRFSPFCGLKVSDSAKSIAFDDESLKEIQPKKNGAPVRDIFEENKAYIEELERKKREAEQSELLSRQMGIKKYMKAVCQVLNTFIILDDGTDLYFADQHALHERLLFDKLTEEYKNNSVVTQPLLVPFILNVNPLEYSFICDKIEVFGKLGIEIEEFGGNSFRISSVPLVLADINISKFFAVILEDVDSLKNINLTDALFDKIAQKACKSAIKSGDALTDKDLTYIEKVLNDNPYLKCPHGRPVMVKISRTEIDKWFKRIV